MNIENILSIVVGALCASDILMRLLFKSKRRIDSAEADNAEAEADTTEWRRYKEELENYHRTIETLQDVIKHQAEQIGEIIKDHTSERADLESRFNAQTDRLREVQRALVDANTREVELVKRIGELELELEKKRCDELPCPFREPPNAYTKKQLGITKQEYFQNKNHN